MKKKYDLDQLIDESINEEVGSIPPPYLSSSEAWERLQQQRRQKSRRMSPNMKALVYVASIILIIVTVTFTIPKNSSAFFKFTEIFYQIQDSVVQLFMKSGESTKNHPDGSPMEGDLYEKGMLIKNMSLEEAKSETSILIKVPSYVPSNFSLDDVTVLYLNGELSKNIYLNYSSGESKFTLNIQELEGNFGFGSTFSEKQSEIEDIIIKGQPATLITYESGKKRLIWTNSNYFFSLEGEISRDDMIAMAESL